MENDTRTVECEIVLSDAQRQTIATFSWSLDVLAYLPIGLVGMMLNMMAMKILLSPSMWNNFFNRLLLCLSAFDSLFILCGLLELLRRWKNSSLQAFLFTNIVYPFRSMAMCSSIYITIVLSLERYQAITSPIQHRNRGVNTSLGKRLLVYILPVTLFSFVYYFPKFFDLYVVEENEDLDCMKNDTKYKNDTNDTETIDDREDCLQTSYKILPTSLRINPMYIFWYLNVSNLVVTCVLPIALLVFMNCRIATCLNKYRQRRPNKGVLIKQTSDATTQSTTNTAAASRQKPNNNNHSDVKQTFMLFSIVILFVFCHALRIIMNTTEFLSREKLEMEHKKGCEGISFWQHISMPLSEVLLLFNSSAHFFVYMFFDKTFQEILKSRFSAVKHACHCPSVSQQPSDSIGSNGERLLLSKTQVKLGSKNNVELTKMTGDGADKTTVTIQT